MSLDAAPTNVAVVWDISSATSVSLGSDVGTQEIIPHRVFAASRRVDEVMSRWGSVAEPVRPVTAMARTASSSARRPVHTVDLDLVGNELDATLGLIADDLAAASR